MFTLRFLLFALTTAEVFAPIYELNITSCSHYDHTLRRKKSLIVKDKDALCLINHHTMET